MDDSVSWSAAASVHAELAAHQIARLKNPWWNPPWTDLVPAANSAPYPPPVAVSIEWGSRRKRSRSASGPSGIGSRRPKPWAAASSPATPLDFGSASPSGCGSDEASSSPENPPSMAAEEMGRRIFDHDVSDGGGYVAKSSLQFPETVPSLGASVVSSKPSSRNGFLLPDLNEPLSDNLD